MPSRWIIPALVALVAVVYVQTSQFAFVDYDDGVYVFENEHVEDGLTWDNFLWAFWTGRAANWHPLTWLSLLLDSDLYGYENAGGFHVTNVVLHALNTVLLYVLLHRMTGATWRSALVAALFAVHPLHVESVAWVAERKDVLSTAFGLLAFLAWLRFVRGGGTRWYAVTAFAFAASLLSKPMFVTFPFILLLLDYWPLGRIAARKTRVEPNSATESADDEPPDVLAHHASLSPTSDRSSDPSVNPSTDEDVRCTEPPGVRRLIVEKLPFLAMTIAMCAVTVHVQRQGDAMRSLSGYPLKARFANTAVAYVLYLKKTVAPVDLAVFYPHPINEIPRSQIVVSIAILAALTFAAVLLIRRTPYLAVGWFWYLGTLVPVIGLVQVGAQQLADRYTYVPLIGVFVAVVWMAGDVASTRRVPRAAFAIAGAAILATLTVLAWRQTFYWRNTITLFQHAIAVTDGNYIAHNNLAVGYAKLGDNETAIAEYRKAIEIRPYYSGAHRNLGLEMERKEQYDDALWHYRKALLHLPDYPAAHVNLGCLLFRMGDVDEARDHYNEALASNENYSDAHNHLGVLLYEQGDRNAAVSHFKKALEIEPKSDDARRNLAAAESGTPPAGERRRTNDDAASDVSATKLPIRPNCNLIEIEG